MHPRRKCTREVTISYSHMRCVMKLAVVCHIKNKNGIKTNIRKCFGGWCFQKKEADISKKLWKWLSWIQAAKENTKAFCKLCFVEINISHGRKHDTEVHVASAKQKSNKASAGKTDIAAAMSDNDLQVVHTETLMTQFIAELNLPLTSADTFMKIVKHMFPDSKVTQRFHCGRNKTTC